MPSDPILEQIAHDLTMASLWPTLSPELKGKLPDWLKHSPWFPHTDTPPRQQQFLDLENEEEVFYGGAAGGGKSESLLRAALRYVDTPGYSAILFRRTYADLALPDALMDRARKWLKPTAAHWSDKDKTWLFPSGAKLVFGYLDTESDKYRYQSAQFQFIGFDELTQFLESQYLYLFSRLRRLRNIDIPLRMRSASNPGGIGAAWVQERFIPDDFTPEQTAENRVFYKTGKDGVRRVFVPARLKDNVYLDQEAYQRSLEKLDPTTRAQLLEGDWHIRDRGNIYPMWEDGPDGRHVITWSQFAAVVGERHIPKHWLGAHGHDPGFDPDPRAGVWNFVAGKNSPLAGDVFCVRELYANRMTVDEYAEKVKEAEAPLGETARIQTRVIGHEASSEQATLLRNHRLTYVKNKPDANGGIAQMRHALRFTHLDSPHPFKPHYSACKEKRCQGCLKGRPHFYVVVADDELINPKTERGMVNFRAEMSAYRYIDASPTEQRGMPRIVPYGFFNHLMDAQRGIAANWFAAIAPLTTDEKVENALPTSLKQATIDAESDPDRSYKLRQSRRIKEAEVRRKVTKKPTKNPLRRYRDVFGGRGF